MSSLLVRASSPDEARRVVDVTPERAGWTYVGFSVLRLAPGEAHRLDTGDRELCAVVLSGTVDLETGGKRFESLGGRRDPFGGPPEAAYVPPGSGVRLLARTLADLALGTAPASGGHEARRLARPRLEVRGKGVMERRIHHILMEDEPAERLLVTEVVTPAGHWSSYPPHKHDEDDPPRETALEEVYYHRLRDPRGFAIQRVYTADRSLDESIAVRDGDLVLVPRGYHTVSAAPGHDLYYLNVMAGPVRRWCVSFDPEHAWLRT